MMNDIENREMNMTIANREMHTNDRAARERTALRRALLAIAPRGLEAMAESLAASGCSLEDARAKLLHAYGVGTALIPSDVPVAGIITGERGDRS